MRKFLMGLLLGVAAGVLYAPATGVRLRSWLRDKITKVSNETVDLVENKRRDLKIQAEGVKQNVNKAIEQAKPHVEQAKSAVQEAYGKVKDQALEVHQETTETIREARNKRSA